MSSKQPSLSYKDAGVDIDAGEALVERIKGVAKRTARPEVMGGLGGFGALCEIPAGYKQPVLVSGTDGVGTKLRLALNLNKHDSIGQDLVAMCVNDLVVCGAEPLFVTDYIATGRVVPERIADIVKGIAAACEAAGCALLGGETAEHPGLLEPDEYDMAGATTGVVERGRILGADRIEAGDVVLAMASSGLHSNGYSLVRKVLLADAGWQLDREVPELGGTLGETLLTPTHVYAKDVLEMIAACATTGADGEVVDGVHAMSHITGGGLVNNLARVVPDHLHVTLERSSWTPSAIFQLVQQVGKVSQPDIEATLNMGVGMVAVLPESQADAAKAALDARGVENWLLGRVDAAQAGQERVSLMGEHPTQG